MSPHGGSRSVGAVSEESVVSGSDRQSTQDVPDGGEHQGGNRRPHGRPDDTDPAPHMMSARPATVDLQIASRTEGVNATPLSLESSPTRAR
jgi:hypothetical protein